MLKKIFTTLLSIVSPIAETPRQPYTPPAFTDTDRFEKTQVLFPEIDLMFKEYAEKNNIPGYSYGILLDGKLVHTGSGGYIDLDKKTPATQHSMFRIASMTKSITAMGILMLRDEGKLKLDDPVYIYIPEIQHQQLTEDSPPITIRDLLTHSGGFPTDDPWGDRLLDITDDQLLSLVKEGFHFSNAASVTFEYSNLGYALLGYIIKRTSGLSFEEFISEKIWEPLGMEAYWEYSMVPAELLAFGYNNKGEKEPLLHAGAFGAMGGMIASVVSFSRYAALHMDAWPPRDDIESGPLKRSSLREMHMPWRFRDLHLVKLSDGRESPLTGGYGYGLGILNDLQKRVFVGHSGGLPGFGCNWKIAPEYSLGIISFTNSTYANTSNLNQAILEKLIKDAPLNPRKLRPSKVLKERQEDLIKLLPHWEKGEESGLFALNFFLDRPIESLKKETEELFTKAGKIISIGDLIAEDQLKGYFIMQGDQASLKVTIALSPDSLIQSTVTTILPSCSLDSK